MARSHWPWLSRSVRKGALTPRRPPGYPRRAMPFFQEQSRGHSAHIGQNVVVHYRWHPLYGRQVRCILTEQRASGEIAHIELEPGVVTKLVAWKLDPVSCSAMKVGVPQVNLAALSDLHRLLSLCESRLLSANGNTVTQEDNDGIAGSTRASNGGGCESEACSLDTTTSARPRPRRRLPPGHDSGGTPRVLKALAQLFLEASGAVTTGGADDDA